MNIQTSNDKLQIFYNATRPFKNKIGDIEGYVTVWFYPEGIVNILPLHRVEK